MSTHNICFRGEIRKYQHFSDEKSALSVAMNHLQIYNVSSVKYFLSWSLKFYSPVNIVKVMSSRPVNLLMFFPGRLSPLRHLPVLVHMLSSVTDNCTFVCVEILLTSQPNGVMSSTVSLLNHTLLGRLSPLSSQSVLCIFFCQQLKAALLESAEGRECPWKMFHDQSPQKNVAYPQGVQPATSWLLIRAQLFKANDIVS